MANICKAAFLTTVYLLLLIACAAGIANAEKRVALVIGNESYAHASKLYNPKKDARDVASALRRLNFEVTEHLDISHDRMRKAVINFWPDGPSIRHGCNLFCWARHGDGRRELADSSGCKIAG